MTEGPLAVVTGASSGIGLALARQFADHGFDVVTAGNGGPVTAEEVDALHTTVRHRTVTALALNAGSAARSGGLERELRRLDTDVRLLVHLAGLVTEEMAASGRGRVLITASTSAAKPASIAFARSFADGLREDMREYGVSVTALEVGPDADDLAAVAKQAFEALMAGREHVGERSITMQAGYLISRIVPDAITARLARLAPWSD